MEQASDKVNTMDKITSYLLLEHYQNNTSSSIFSYLPGYFTSKEDRISFSQIFTSVTKKLFYLFPSLEGLYLYTNDGTPVIFDSRDFTRLSFPSLMNDSSERDLELQMLRHQINPHFLYNTLESMQMVAYTEGAHDCSQMCLLLADVFRYGTSSPHELVTVKEEIKHVKEYITLQQYRFHYSVKINVMVSQDLYAFMLPKLIIQPIIENALNHGFEEFNGNERVEIFGYQKEDSLYIKIADNGIGMTPEQVELLNGYIRGENEEFTSIGIKNVHRRIALYYGDDYGLTIESYPKRGASVLIHLPARRQYDKEGKDYV